MEHVKDKLNHLLVEMQALPENRTEAALEVANPKLSFIAKPPSELSPSEMPNGKPKIRDSREAQNQLSRLLQGTYVMLKKFGEAADVAEMRDTGFQLVLGEYAIDDVTAAFVAYLKTGKEIPTPADIVGIVNPSTRQLCPNYYRQLVEKDRRMLNEGRMFRLDDDEKAYIEKYEHQQLRRV